MQPQKRENLGNRNKGNSAKKRKVYLLSKKYPLQVNSIQRCLTNRSQLMVRSASSNKIERDVLTLESMAFRITLGSDAR